MPFINIEQNGKKVVNVLYQYIDKLYPMGDDGVRHQLDIEEMIQTRKPR